MPKRRSAKTNGCGSGGMFVSSEKFVEAHGGRLGDISIFGQESNPMNWRLAQMDLAIRGIECHLGPHHADSFHSELHKDLKADYVLANPPFNDSDWGGDRLREDARWKFGTPPAGNANFAWVQHFLHHLAPTGIAGFVLAKQIREAVGGMPVVAPREPPLIRGEMLFRRGIQVARHTSSIAPMVKAVAPHAKHRRRLAIKHDAADRQLLQCHEHLVMRRGMFRAELKK